MLTTVVGNNDKKTYVVYCMMCKNSSVKDDNYCFKIPFSIICRCCCTCKFCVEWQLNNKRQVSLAKRRRKKLKEMN